MMIDLIKQQTYEFNSISKHKRIVENAENQRRLDSKFKDLVQSTIKYFKIIEYCSGEFGLTLSDECSDKSKKLLESLNACVSDSLVDEETYKESEKKLKEFEKQIKSDWTDFYKVKTDSIKGTLGIINSINRSGVEKCLADINKGENWGYDIQNYEQMKKGLNDAQNIINNLNLNDNVIVFLKKIAAKRAIITDLTPDIMDWIYKENLEKKIKIII